MCVVVDKVDKLPREAVVAQLKEVGCDDEAVEGILGALTIASIDALREILGSDAEPVQARRKRQRSRSGVRASSRKQRHRGHSDGWVARGMA